MRSMWFDILMFDIGVKVLNFPSEPSDQALKPIFISAATFPMIVHVKSEQMNRQR